MQKSLRGPSPAERCFMPFKFHTVSKGDTLAKIIRKYYGGFDIRRLDMVMAANALDDPDKIRVGQKLKLPGNWSGARGAVAPPVTDIPHTDRQIGALVDRTGPSGTPTAGRAAPAAVAKPLGDQDYWKDRFHKDLIVLHFTAGYDWQGAYATFKKPGRVATPFLVGLDGTIYRLFDERCWAYHLGIKGRASENSRHDKRSIGIEIVNIGPAWSKNGHWVDYTGKTWPADHIIKGANRGAQGGVAFPQLQVDAVCALVNWLLCEYRIPRRIPADSTGFQLPVVAGFRGVATHQMFRRDKYDLGPAFPYAQLIRDCGLEKVAL